MAQICYLENSYFKIYKYVVNLLICWKQIKWKFIIFKRNLKFIKLKYNI